MGDRERCRPLVDDDGQFVASVRGSGDLDDRARRALLDVVAAAHRRHASMPTPAVPPAGLSWCPTCVGRLAERAGALGRVAAELASGGTR